MLLNSSAVVSPRFLHSSSVEKDMPNNADTGESTVKFGNNNLDRLLIKTLSKRGEIWSRYKQFISKTLFHFNYRFESNSR